MCSNTHRHDDVGVALVISLKDAGAEFIAEADLYLAALWKHGQNVEPLACVEADLHRISGIADSQLLGCFSHVRIAGGDLEEALG